MRWVEIKEWYYTHESHVAVGALVLGFIFDSLTLNRPDQLLDNSILLTYLLIAGGTILLMSMRAARGKVEGRVAPFLPLVLQFCFGSLSSGLLVLYFRSGTVAQSLIFFGILAALLIGNEFLKSRYAQFRFNIAIYYLLLLCYVAMTTPVVLRSIGPGIFVISGVLSVALIGAYLWLLYVSARQEIARHVHPAAGIVAAIFVLFNVLYFVNVIPPVPLALKDIGVYHSLLRKADGSYIALYEPRALWEVWRATNSHYTLTESKSAFCFSSVFAPADLRTPIYHKWELKNPAGEWEVRSRVSFGINGGRDDGYRGWSVKSALIPGEWRCSVETAQGSLIGRVNFTVVESATAPVLSQKTL